LFGSDKRLPDRASDSNAKGVMMTAILVLLTFIVFLLLDYFVAKPKKPAVKPQTLMMKPADNLLPAGIIQKQTAEEIRRWTAN